MSRELLERAAKAAGAVHCDQWDDGRLLVSFDGKRAALWNPIDDDGDAFRLAVKLGIGLEYAQGYTAAYAGSRMAEQFTERHGSDPYAATRLAIVRAAAMGEKP